MLDLYKLYKIPKELRGYNIAYETVPELAWDKYYYNKQPFESSKYLYNREHLWAKSAEISYWYAVRILRGRFLAGEAIVAIDAGWACAYAIDVIKGRFIEAESVIKANPYYASLYTF